MGGESGTVVSAASAPWRPSHAGMLLFFFWGGGVTECRRSCAALMGLFIAPVTVVAVPVPHCCSSVAREQSAHAFAMNETQIPI